MKNPLIICYLIGIASLHGEILYERGSLREFVGGNSTTSEYDNYVSHVVEGIADPGYNDYGPDWLDVQSNGFGNYTEIPENSPILTYWQVIFQSIVVGDTTTADQLLSDSLDIFHYNLVVFTDTTTNREYFMVREQLDMSFVDQNLPATPNDDVTGSFTNGWGLFVYSPSATRSQVLFEVPHPCDDFISPYIATEAFLVTDARAICYSGTGREVIWTNVESYSNNKSLSDPSRNANTVFHVFHQVVSEALFMEALHSPIVFQIHSFDNDAHEGLHSIVLSAGALHPIANKPIRDLSSDHRDIINFTEEITIYANTFGPHGLVRVDGYYEVFYDDNFQYFGDYGTYPIKKATELKGSSSNVQLNHIHGMHNSRDVYEPFVHVECDEKPEIFDAINMPLDTLYAGEYPTSYMNFSILLEYYEPFINALDAYLTDWETVTDITSPDSISIFYPVTLLPDNSNFQWAPVEDTNFESYRIYFDTLTIQPNSPYFDRNQFSFLADMRTNHISIPTNVLPDTCFLSIRAIDYLGNESPLSESVPNYFANHGLPVTVVEYVDTLQSFGSYGDEDVEPEGWSFDSAGTDQLLLSLFGNTWKTQSINPYSIDSTSVWIVNTKIDSIGEIQGLGFRAGNDILWYSFHGLEELDIEEWVTVYQGYFPTGLWNTIYLPIGDDWIARFEYEPEIEEIIYVNDADAVIPGSIQFRSIVDLTPDQYIPPEVSIQSDVGPVRRIGSERNVVVDFSASIQDPDSYIFQYLWHFGDGSTSPDPDPSHTYSVLDDHTYSVVLEVIDQQGEIGRGYAHILVDEGESSLPIRLNFVGDIMLARRLEDAGGVIPTNGVDALFEPTIELFGNAADLSIANLECVLTDRGSPHPTKSIVYRGSPENVTGLENAGIDIVSLANNHMLDYGDEGLYQTQTLLTNANINFSGAGENSVMSYRPLIVSRKGISLAFLASSDRTGQYNNYQPYLNAGLNKTGFAYMTPYYIREQINQVKNDVDLVIMEFHAGSEYSVEPGAGYDNYDPSVAFAEQRQSRTAYFGVNNEDDQDEDYSYRIDVPHMWDREIRQFALNEGADLVVVHHPHKIQGMEVIDGKLIAHSLGNFIFDMDYPETMPSVILNAEAEPDSFIAFSLNPIFIDHYIPNPATGELGNYILYDLAMKSFNLNTYLHVDPFSQVAHIVLDPASISQYHIPNRRSFSIVDGSCRPISIHTTGGISLMNTVTPDDAWDMRFGRELLWYGNFESEGSNMWNTNSDDESIVWDEYHDGERSLFHRRTQTSGDNIVTNLLNRLPLKPDIPITLSGWIKTDNGNNVTIEIRFYETRYSTTIISTFDSGEWVTGNSSWKYYWNDIDVPANAQFFDIRCNSGLPDSGEANSWFDDISVLQWETWLPVSGDMIIPYPNDYVGMQLNSTADNDTGVVEFYESYLDNPPIVIPEFSVEQRAIQVPSVVQFNNTSEGLHGWWQWDFGDGVTSINKEPVHEYTSPGFYDVTLSILDHNGIYQTTTLPNYIVAISDTITQDGDINLDGNVNVLDIITCVNFILGYNQINPDQFIATDLNVDFQINIFDLLLLADIVITGDRIGDEGIQILNSVYENNKTYNNINIK